MLNRDSGFEIFMQDTPLSTLPTVKFLAYFMQPINHEKYIKQLLLETKMNFSGQNLQVMVMKF